MVGIFVIFLLILFFTFLTWLLTLLTWIFDFKNNLSKKRKFWYGLVDTFLL